MVDFQADIKQAMFRAEFRTANCKISSALLIVISRERDGGGGGGGVGTPLLKGPGSQIWKIRKIPRSCFVAGLQAWPEIIFTSDSYQLSPRDFLTVAVFC